MGADELQRLASILRWVGLFVTALGVALTFGSHFIADRLFVAQRADKIQAQERLKITEAELEQTKLKTAELAKRQEVSNKRAAAGFKGGSRTQLKNFMNEANASVCSSMTQSQRIKPTTTVSVERGEGLGKGSVTSDLVQNLKQRGWSQ